MRGVPKGELCADCSHEMGGEGEGPFVVVGTPGGGGEGMAIVGVAHGRESVGRCPSRVTVKRGLGRGLPKKPVPRLGGGGRWPSWRPSGREDAERRVVLKFELHARVKGEWCN